jgi:hypothetical protein
MFRTISNPFTASGLVPNSVRDVTDRRRYVFGGLAWWSIQKWRAFVHARRIATSIEPRLTIDAVACGAERGRARAARNIGFGWIVPPHVVYESVTSDSVGLVLS